MPRFIEGEPRTQSTLFPERLEDYIDEDNPVRVVEAFIDGLDLEKLGFEGMIPKQTGRPAYHPSTMLKLYVYGYLNRIQSSRRLEKESGRNVELMWLLGRLTPDYKTIANFRKDNGKAIRQVCAEFIGLCRKLDLFSQGQVAIDGSKFKAVNNRDRNFTPAKIKRRRQEIERSIGRYFDRLDKVDRTDPGTVVQTQGLEDKLSALKDEMKRLAGLEAEVEAAPDKQVSLTDPDARSMHTRGTGMVGYNVQSAVDTEHHLIVTHEVTMDNSDRGQLSPMAKQARTEMGVEDLEAVADRGYFKSQEIKACVDAGIDPVIPKPLTSNNKARGQFDKQDFRYDSEADEYICPAQERLTRRTTMQENGKTMIRYWSSNCRSCPLKPQCTTGKERRVSRWEHEDILEDMQQRLDHHPDKMRIRRETVEHPFGTIKAWMGATHFLMTGHHNVRTEMSLHVLAYNLKRVMNILGTESLIEAIRALLPFFIRLFRSLYPVRGLC
jgi:transposase